jgi:hypothetical protein
MDILVYAHEHGDLWDARVLEECVLRKDLFMLQYALANGCPWHTRVAAAAARSGSLSWLQWVRQYGCPWDEDTLVAAVGNCYLDVLVWARSQGCPWSVRTYDAARSNVTWGRRGCRKVLSWLVANGCPQKPLAAVLYSTLLLSDAEPTAAGSSGDESTSSSSA